MLPDGSRIVDRIVLKFDETLVLSDVNMEPTLSGTNKVLWRKDWKNK
jgi:hypothetical protein